jgi:putative Mg2+ transporter-C (MgtC) family protein
MQILEWNEILLRLALASLFGGLIGLERERKEWAAGLRTHMMVCVGSCLIMIVSAYGFYEVLAYKDIKLDPSRVAAQVISGIGFIGAGTIMFLKQGTIRGLTTASGLWTVAAIGLATGGGLYFAAAITTVIALIILWAMIPFEQRYSRKYRQRSLRVVTNMHFDNTNIINTVFGCKEVKIYSFNMERDDDDFILLFRFDDHTPGNTAMLMEMLKLEPGIKEISWSN